MTSQLTMASTALSDIGYVRHNNQDSAFAGARLIAVADGMGGHAGGDTASTIAIRSVAHVENSALEDISVSEIAKSLETSIMAAHDAIVGKAKHEQKLAGMGTTITSVALVNDYWILAHIGDSRAYILRDGHILLATKDHSYVQHLIDTGHITEEEAKNHPLRNRVMRVVGDFDIDPHPDIAIRKAHPGDRWLLCSDGLSGVLSDETIETVLREVPIQEECAERLINMALKAGSTDNISAVICDATTIGAQSAQTHQDANNSNIETADSHDTTIDTAPTSEHIPLVAGAATQAINSIADAIGKRVLVAPALHHADSPAARAAELTQQTNNAGEDATAVPLVAIPSTDNAEGTKSTDTSEIPIVVKDDGTLSDDPHDPDVKKEISKNKRDDTKQQRKHKTIRRIIIAIVTAIILAGASVGCYIAWNWSQQKYYIGEQDNAVAIYQGIPTSIFNFKLSHVVKTTSIPISHLPDSWKTQIAQGITVDSYEEAEQHVDLIAEQSDLITKNLNERHSLQKEHKNDTAKNDTAKSDKANNSATQQHDANEAKKEQKQS